MIPICQANRQVSRARLTAFAEANLRPVDTIVPSNGITIVVRQVFQFILAATVCGITLLSTVQDRDSVRKSVPRQSGGKSLTCRPIASERSYIFGNCHGSRRSRSSHLSASASLPKCHLLGSHFNF